MLKSDKIDLAVINAGFALKNGLTLEHDAVILEKQNDLYSNVVVVRQDEVNEPKIKALAKAITSKQLKDYIEKQYQGALIPTF
jgi:D-methionine transport system substrate-binding protein